MSFASRMLKTLAQSNTVELGRRVSGAREALATSKRGSSIRYQNSGNYHSFSHATTIVNRSDLFSWGSTGTGPANGLRKRWLWGHMEKWCARKLGVNVANSSNGVFHFARQPPPALPAAACVGPLAVPALPPTGRRCEPLRRKALAHLSAGPGLAAALFVSSPFCSSLRAEHKEGDAFLNILVLFEFEASDEIMVATSRSLVCSHFVRHVRGPGANLQTTLAFFLEMDVRIPRIRNVDDQKNIEDFLDRVYLITITATRPLKCNYIKVSKAKLTRSVNDSDSLLEHGYVLACGLEEKRYMDRN
ncbi:Protein of unknown function [Gryllus bimaculatus]|nr:Protein of unknown function [Gryllus bimaculatus]